ncbi:hypothetical protein GH714_013588 [Hevea brasiliensis]|uniref:Transposase Tnp1/En/Spm-like domain-containing protein n=1 Tax=Hevea brasiliensis TaxID=3981 RepID=A0A6A6KNE3_HEVBR|nr:hypothetical protein GH714_013588 [Hevea brasiliensis]
MVACRKILRLAYIIGAKMMGNKCSNELVATARGSNNIGEMFPKSKRLRKLEFLSSSNHSQEATPISNLHSSRGEPPFEDEPLIKEEQNQIPLRDPREQVFKKELEIIDNQGNKIKKRGPTRAKDIWSLLDGHKIVIQFNKLGQPIEKGGGILGGWLGTLARKVDLCPIDYFEWRKVSNTTKSNHLLIMEGKFHFPSNHKTERSERGKVARSHQRTPHTTGSKSYARSKDEYLGFRKVECFRKFNNVTIENEVYDELMGIDKYGCVKGYGLGVKAKEVCDTQSQNIRTTSVEELKMFYEAKLENIKQSYETKLDGKQQNIVDLQEKLGNVTSLLEKLVASHTTGNIGISSNSPIISNMHGKSSNAELLLKKSPMTWRLRVISVVVHMGIKFDNEAKWH